MSPSTMLLLTVAVAVTSVQSASLAGSAAASNAGSTTGSVSEGWGLSMRFESSNCSGTPVELLGDHECVDSSSECALSDSYTSASDVPDLGVSSACVSDLPAYLAELFGDQTCLRYDSFNVTDCSADFLTTDALLADGLCHAQYMSDPTVADPIILATETTISANGSASVVYYDMADCSGQALTALSFTEEQLAGNQCSEGNIAYSNAKAEIAAVSGSKSTTDGATSLSMGVIAAVVGTCATLLA
jgi:hypothetical protein